MHTFHARSGRRPREVDEGCRELSGARSGAISSQRTRQARGFRGNWWRCDPWGVRSGEVGVGVGCGAKAEVRNQALLYWVVRAVSRAWAARSMVPSVPCGFPLWCGCRNSPRAVIDAGLPRDDAERNHMILISSVGVAVCFLRACRDELRSTSVPTALRCYVSLSLILWPCTTVGQRVGRRWSRTVGGTFPKQSGVCGSSLGASDTRGTACTTCLFTLRVVPTQFEERLAF